MNAESQEFIEWMLSIPEEVVNERDWTLARWFHEYGTVRSGAAPPIKRLIDAVS
jgi:hypothetical protein